MKLKIICALPLLLWISVAFGQSGGKQNSKTALFPLGVKVQNENFTGDVWLQMLVSSDTVYNSNIGSVTFSPAARTKWHYHPGGQLLMVTEGKGLYQEKGKAIQTIKKGDVIKCPPNIHHWHGATPKEGMTHIAIGTNTQKGSVVWLDYVSDLEYQPIK